MSRRLAATARTIRVGDVITSDPRRDFDVVYMEADDFGGVTVYTSDSVRAYVGPDQTVTILRGEA